MKFVSENSKANNKIPLSQTFQNLFQTKGLYFLIKKIHTSKKRYSRQHPTRKKHIIQLKQLKKGIKIPISKESYTMRSLEIGQGQIFVPKKKESGNGINTPCTIAFYTTSKNVEQHKQR